MADSKFKFKDIGEGIAGAAAIAATFLMPVIRVWYRKWGATDAEVHRSLPGDDLVPHPTCRYTHAITIRASAAEIWPWLVQMGHGRGGCTATNGSKTWLAVISTTRLIARSRSDYNPSLGNALVNRVFMEPISLVMDRKMLLGIKQRVEAAAER